MGRPCLRRKINFNPKVKYFKPQGVPIATLDVIELKKESVLEIIVWGKIKLTGVVKFFDSG